MFQNTKDLIERTGNPGEEPLLETLLSALVTVSCDAIDLICVKECLDRLASLLTNFFSKEPKGTRGNATQKGGHTFAKTGGERDLFLASRGGTDVPPTKRKRKPNPIHIARTQAYARVQEAFRKSRKRCVYMVVNGEWGQEAATLGVEEQEAYWRPLFEEPSKPDNRPVLNVPED